MEHVGDERLTYTFGLADAVYVVRSHWRAITLLTLLCTLLALGWTLIQPKIYSATASALVITTGELDINQAVAADALAKSKVLSYQSLALSRPVANRVVESLSLDVSPQYVNERITTEVPFDTAEIRINATSPESPQHAADLANAWVTALAEQVGELEADQDVLGRVEVQPLSVATPPPGPASPNLKRNLGIGLFLGAFLGMLYALVRHRMDHRIRSVEEIREVFGVTVLGTIPRDHRLADRRFLLDRRTATKSGNDPVMEAMRKLRTSLSFASPHQLPRIIVVTSPLNGAGKSTITANLAVAVASTGRNVVVVDGDLRRPVIADLFGLAPGIGVADVLTGQMQLEEALQTYDGLPNLHVLGAGDVPKDPAEILSSEAVGAMLQTLAQDALVLVDAPPLLPVTDAELLTVAADGVLIVVEAQATLREELSATLDNIYQIHGTVFGVVINRVPTAGADAALYRHFSNNYEKQNDKAHTVFETKAVQPELRDQSAGTTSTKAWGE
ncbi:polysaccharide biosynthesis tyrosine autokinase [Kocuria rosea]|uniref:polysaccharide biosynthesis tyrosine autokinase n=1 Tax=Kocuria rosea TaxID=1275 RepID=UPI000DFE583A|nr:polysaccharide biosynthesis tyrosine autokinase [Kocuria rosea]STX04978.1 Tyrosine-protein kinase ptk [Kocuria rosea]